MDDRRWLAVGRVIAIIGIAVIATWFVRRAAQPLPPPVIATDDVECPVTAQERYDRADVVVTATVDFVLPADGHQAKVIAVPKTVWKGKLAFPTMTVMATALDYLPNADTLRPVPLNFQTGDTVYLIYGRRQLDGTYQTRPCDGSRVFGSGFSADETATFEGQPPDVDGNPGPV